MLFFGLFLALPIVILGALTEQNTQQQAAPASERPNIIFITVPKQRQDGLFPMANVTKRLGGRGITFSHAFSIGASESSRTALSSDMAAAGYEVKELTGDPESVGQQAREFVTAANEPFYLSLALQPGTAEQTDCGSSAISTSPSFDEADVSDKPVFIKALPRLTTKQKETLLNEATEQVCFFLSVDQAVGRLLDGLGNRWADTVIIYTSEQADAAGDHRIIGKDCLYDSCRLVPLVISYPAKQQSAQSIPYLVSTADIEPTIRQLSQMGDGNGVSLVGYFTRPEVALRTNLLMHLTSTESQRRGETVGVRTKDYSYIEWPTGERELYDLNADPYQLVNLAKNPEYQTIIDGLSLEIAGQAQ